MHFFLKFLAFVSDWSSYSDPSGPISNGLSAGLDSLGNEIYIGRGTFNGYLTPGRLAIKTVCTKTPGVYVEFDGIERQITTNIEYYAKNPKCNYKWVPSSNGATVSNAIMIQTINSVTYYVGRVLAGGSLHVGKVFLNYKMIYESGLVTSTYEVLVCESNKFSTSLASFSNLFWYFSICIRLEFLQ